MSANSTAAHRHGRRLLHVDRVQGRYKNRNAAIQDRTDCEYVSKVLPGWLHVGPPPAE
jgi:hypothetical protein